ncbi:MAG: twin-arginine translocase TatA/TatE family subunit [Bacteroidota bacterium]|jgi:sec-independent protein translocase protein TatA|nr:twin-arginine translocase TatA/TatE family subunit [bacterium]NBP63208.1 twin-arginine translocase TatA/TatE family subunit [Bacteroidota bacterium]
MGFLPGGSEWLIILLVIIILFGAKKIPELMRGLGSGIREFKNAANSTDDKDTKNDAPKSE